MGKLGVVSCLVVGAVWAGFAGCGGDDDGAPPAAYGGRAGSPGSGAGAGRGGRSGATGGVSALPGDCWLGPLGECNPLTVEGCSTPGAACDLLGDGQGTTYGFGCFEPPNVQGIDEPCDNQEGPFCEPTLHCSPPFGPDGSSDGPAVCKKLCCDESSCRTGESCQAIEHLLGTLGLCLPDAPGGSGGSGGGEVELPAGCWLGPRAECNPLTLEGCSAPGASCDLANDGQGTLLGLLCFAPPPPNDQVLGAACQNDLNGPFCEPTLHCTPSSAGAGGSGVRPLSCQKVCCAATDCGAGETCLAFEAALGTLGTCQPGTGGAGAGGAGSGGAGSGGAGSGGAGSGGAGAGGAGANGSAGASGSAGANGGAGAGGAGTGGSAGASGSAGAGGASAGGAAGGGLKASARMR